MDSLTQLYMASKSEIGLCEGGNTNRDNCEELFGKFLFGEYTKFYKKNKELNTELENDLFHSVSSWIKSAGQRQLISKNLSLLFKCKDMYPKVLGQTSDYFYRAYTLPMTDDITKTQYEFEIALYALYMDYKQGELTLREFNSLYKKLNIDKNWFRYSNFDHSYKPQYKMESWTTSKTSALKFANTAMHVPTGFTVDRHGMTVIVKAKLDKSELLFSKSFMNALSTEHGFGKQNEVLRIVKNKKPIKTSAIYIPLITGSTIRNLFKGVIDQNKLLELISIGKTNWAEF